jgi:hypothetical protein
MKNREQRAPGMEEMSQGAMQEQTELTRALSRQPEVTVPAGFAARVTASLPPRGVVRARARFSVARGVALAAAVALAVTLFVLAPHVETTRSLAFGLEMLLLVQLAGIGYGLVRMNENGL